MKNNLGFLVLAIALSLFALPLHGAEYASFDSFYNAGGIGFWGWTGIIVGSLAVAALTYFTFGGGAAAAPAWMSTVGGWIGSTVGLSGIAASNFGLALLGGGSIAAGGLGVAGGVTLLATITSFGTDVAITYGTDIALEKWSYSRFIDANKEMLTLPLPRNEKGGKAYKEAMDYLKENMKEDKTITDPENRVVLFEAIEILKEKKTDEKNKDYILKNDVLLALLQLQANDFVAACDTSWTAIYEAKDIKENDSLPSFIYGLASLSVPDRAINTGVIDALRNAYFQEPDNQLIPLMTGCCMDRIMYRYHLGMISSEHLSDFFRIITDEKIDDKLAAESLNIFITRCLIELKRTKQDFYIVFQDKALMTDMDVIEELNKRYDRHEKLISLLQERCLNQMIRLSKKFPEDSEITAENLLSLLDSYWCDLPELKIQISLKDLFSVLIAAYHGKADALYNLGDYFFYGAIVEKNFSEAAKLYRKAAEQGNALAQYKLGICYKDGFNDYAEAMKWLQLAAEQGNANAQYELGCCYENQNNDKNEAKKWYLKAAGQGHIKAFYALKQSI